MTRSPATSSPWCQLASRHLPLPIISQIILPLGLVVRPAARQLQIEVPILRKNLWILFLHKSKDLFPNHAAYVKKLRSALRAHKDPHLDGISFPIGSLNRNNALILY